jgi:hypothetical protein
MAITNHERVGKALELLRDGLRPFVARELESKHGKYWITTVTAGWPNELIWREGEDAPQMDAAELTGKLGSQAEVARELAYRLYTICERKKRAAEALAYNGLVQSWPEIQRLAQVPQAAAEQATLF